MAVNLDPLPMDQYAAIDSDRERGLQAIGDAIGHWIKWTAREFADEGKSISADTHIWLNGYDGAPPHWPSIGQLTRWLEVLRGPYAGSKPLVETTEELARCEAREPDHVQTPSKDTPNV